MARTIKQQFVNSDGSLGAVRALAESRAGSGNFNTEVDASAVGATAAVFGSEYRVQYNREAKGDFNPAQFVPASGQLYFSDMFSFSVDFGGWMSIADRLKVGINCFNTANMTDDQRGQIPAKSGMYYVGESAIHRDKEGCGIYALSLAEYENLINGPGSFEGVGQPNGTLVNFMRMCPNIENSQFLLPGNLSDPPYDGTYGEPGFFGQGHNENWNTFKTKSILCEADGVTRTFDQLAALGRPTWENEINTRKNNRFALLIEVCKRKSAAGALVCYGTAIKQGYPISNSDGGLFVEGNINVTFIPGSSNGTVTLNGNTYQLAQGKSFYSHENFDQGYWYIREPGQGYSDANWQQSTSYPQIWGKIAPEHVVANEKGFWQECRRKMRLRRADSSTVGIFAQKEAIYEGDSSRCPLPSVQPGAVNDGVLQETPKLLRPPYYVNSEFKVYRFLCGNDDKGNGYYSFPIQYYGPTYMCVPFSNNYWARWNKEAIHSYTALYQARMEMQPYERWFTGSTLIEDPDVKISGSWVHYSGSEAYADGNVSNMKPSCSIRFKNISGANPGTEVLILIGMCQGFNVSRTDEVRAPGGGFLGNNSFKITYTGPQARVVACFVPASVTNQSIDLGNFGVADWEPAGYSGFINS